AREVRRWPVVPVAIERHLEPEVAEDLNFVSAVYRSSYPTDLGEDRQYAGREVKCSFLEPKQVHVSVQHPGKGIRTSLRTGGGRVSGLLSCRANGKCDPGTVRVFQEFADPGAKGRLQIDALLRTLEEFQSSRVVPLS